MLQHIVTLLLEAFLDEHRIDSLDIGNDLEPFLLAEDRVATLLAKLRLSDDTPTTSRLPSAAERLSTRTWPTWNTSNVPKVITVLPATASSPLCQAVLANPTGSAGVVG